MTTREGEFSFEIKDKLGVLSTHSTGWTKEINIVQWNGGSSKFDIRDWDQSHERMSRGVTLREEEAKTLAELISKYFDSQTKDNKEENL